MVLLEIVFICIRWHRCIFNSTTCNGIRYGMIFCLVAFVAIIFIIVRTVLFGDPTSGWPSMVCIIMFIAGVQLLCMGILGQYMAKTYLETKKRPLYLVEETEED